MPDAGKYDVIFVGSPIWWYTAATPIMAFLERIDFKDRKVVPFSTQGSNVGSFLKDFVKIAKNADVTGYRSFNNMGEEHNRAVDNKISTWLNELSDLMRKKQLCRFMTCETVPELQFVSTHPLGVVSPVFPCVQQLFPQGVLPIIARFPWHSRLIFTRAEATRNSSFSGAKNAFRNWSNNFAAENLEIIPWTETLHGISQ
jgi:hypothetical protein